MDRMPFSGNPLHRASNERKDEDWLAQLSEVEGSRYLPFWRLSALTHSSDSPRLLWLDPAVRHRVDGTTAPVLLGIRDNIAHYALDVSSLADPLTTLGDQACGMATTGSVAPSAGRAQTSVVPGSSARGSP